MESELNYTPFKAITTEPVRMCESVSHIISPLAKLFTVSRLLMVTNVVRVYCDGWCESVRSPQGRDVSHDGGREGGSDSSNLQFPAILQYPPSP